MSEIQKTLSEIEVDSPIWMSIWRCRVCSRLWAGEYSFSSGHGGGPACFYPVSCVDPLEWIEHAKPVCDELARAHEDKVYFDPLGPELGPEHCNEPG